MHCALQFWWGVVFIIVTVVPAGAGPCPYPSGKYVNTNLFDLSFAQKKMSNFTAVIECKIANGDCVKLSAGYCKVVKSGDGILNKRGLLNFGLKRSDQH